MWDPALVLNTLGQWGTNEKLNLEKLSKKLVTLLALITGQRMQTLALIDVRNIEETNGRMEVKIPDGIKTSAVNRLQSMLPIHFFVRDLTICPATALKDYLDRSKTLRGSENKLFISFNKPYKQVSSTSLSRWIKNVLSLSGINTEEFSEYSTHHASTSMANKSGVHNDLIRKTAG